MSTIAWIVLAIGAGVAFLLGIAVGGSQAKKKLSESNAGNAGGSDGTAGEGTGEPRAGSDTHAAPALRQAAIIYNPTKNGMGNVKSIAATVCRNEGWAEPLMIETTEDDPGVAMGKEAVEAGVQVAIAAGGDGTVRAVAQALEGTDTPLGIIPMGTGNLLARNLSIPTDRFEWALRVALWGQDSVIDAARLRTKPDGEQMLFAVMAGLGYDAAVMSSTSESEKSKIGWLAYVKSGSRKLIGKPSTVYVQYDEKPAVTQKVRAVIGGNCGRVQGGIELIPGAVIDDGYLDVLTVSPKNVAQWAGVLTSIIGRSRKGPHTNVTRCKKVTVRSDHQLDVQVDGDVLGVTKFLELTVVPSALTVRTPSPEQVRHIRMDSMTFGWN